ncbi:4-carboxymuconolactone decarboxylase [Phenylobacterium sp.]|uniref:4-carboxymuconolactone decarboxylase n=1 Tax=Phenylobacterium sp. TaxID=1871053 RepID=UPI0025EACFFF|nr:4-carboxymuconolactone decarboxylase [Phenylobacterium sp.]MBX3484855.1 4-carboxymuconolactone decarboxylase [Phenylobacterium sp.]MCW5761576.1 4-carboxymuconolactone decarboxylase [Phenylobacterium sp.]
MDERERHALGMANRRAVLGEAYVDAAAAAATPLTAEFQDLITRYAWGEVWSRPGLPHDTRRLLTVAMLIALNREGELRLHLKAALEHGVPAEALKEVILQSAIYCGVPAANAAFHLASALLADREA